MVSNQYDQFSVGGMPEHSVEATHIVLPVLQRNIQTERQSDRQTNRQTGTGETNLLILGKAGRNNMISEDRPRNL